MNRAHRSIVAFATALAVGSCFPVASIAETSSELQTQLDQAKSRLSELYASAEGASNELNKTMDDLAFTEKGIDETQAQIEAKQLELGDAQKSLGQTTALQYKNGTVSLLSMALSSTSFDDFVSRIYYANKVSEAYNRQIEEVKDLQNDLAQKKTSLEEQKSSLETLRDEQEQDKAQLEAKASEVESYVSGLSNELQQALAAEEAARAEAARAEAEAALQKAQEAQQSNNAAQSEQTKQEPKQDASKEPKKDEQSKEQEKKEDESKAKQEEPQSSKTKDEEDSGEESSKSEEESNTETTEEPNQESSESGLSNMDARTAVVNYVLAQIGKPYVWATHGPDSYDCSGLTGAAYDSIGYSIGYSDSYQVQYCNKPASEAEYGDIVWRSGHVGICIGGGVTVEAHSPSQGIGYGSIDNFELSGSPLG